MSHPANLVHERPKPRPRLRRRSAALHLIVAVGVAVAVLIGSHAVKALDANAPGKSQWCVAAADNHAPPSCVYDDFLACTVAALRAGGACKSAESVAAEAIEAQKQRAAAAPRRSKQPTTTTYRSPEPPLSKPEREKLF